MSHSILFGSQKESAIAWSGVALLAVLVASRIITHKQNLTQLGHLPGLRTAYTFLSLPAALFPRSRWLWFPGLNFLWQNRKNLYKPYGVGIDTISWMGWLTGTTMILSSNIEVMRAISPGTKSDWHKPDFSTELLKTFGDNIFAASGGEAWRSHRRAMGPAFTQGLYQLVWRKTASLYREMVATEGWADGHSVEINRIQDHTSKFSLLILSSCCLGLNFEWLERELASVDDTEMSLLRALEVVNTQMVLGLIPSWVLRLPFKYFRDYVKASRMILEWIGAQVVERKDIIRSRSELGADQLAEDCFTMMVKANEEEGSKFRMTDQELVGNMYILLFAGHDSTSNALAATLAYLAIDTDIQDEIVEQIVSVVGWDRDTEFDDYRKLDKVLAAFFEGTRLYPPASLLFRESLVDTTIPIQGPVGEDGTKLLPIRKGTLVVIDLIGMQHNERYFDEPEKFKPWRWLGLSPVSDAMTAFGAGPRACIGRQFATTEAVALLTMFLRDWKVEPLLSSGETLEGWKERVFDANLRLTLGMKDLPLRLVRREKSG
ncbi:cytochrome P450 [Coprinopsis marcescibilis]|uniref:Cytochrome P450 n=1 Tax=Coprinopsis marcescibilis TaxID=230819 RepID=A0A5C3L7A5_COPMA|nr:cytochrome P450 [Coprinopsis marcescibilis]